ncbi:MAG TPA: glycosyltransferase family 2 protein [Chitinophagaceae bacterium]|nr:glycosyltransferase family 2 protein [Chitinophagaceae bacterium]HMU58727.1 glycosyltransferase family 2 protein [Chitinophagaceae bacterium]
MKKVSIIIPCFNEEKTISQIIQKVIAAELPLNLQKEIIVINDGSIDSTKEILTENRKQYPEIIKIITNNKNQGKGISITKGLKETEGEILIIQDADLEYDPKDYDKLINPILYGNADVVYGSRFIGDGPHRVLFFWHRIGNKLLTFCSNMTTGLNLTDMETGYKVFKTEILKRICLKEKRFGFEPEVTAKISKIRGIRIYETGIAYYGRTYAEGKKINWKDGFRALFCIFKYSLVR